MDATSINGSSIRSAGRTGRIVAVSDSTVSVAWLQKGFASVIEFLPRTSDRLTEDIQVLTLKDGWVPLAGIVGLQEDQMSEVLEVIKELNAIAGRESLFEALTLKKNKIKNKLKKSGKGKGTKGKKFEKKGKAKEPKKTIKKSEREKGESSKAPAEPSEHNPFKRKSPLGHGPGTPPGWKGRGPRTVARKRHWKCSRTDTNSQHCVGIAADTEGQEKTVNIDPKYKTAYNKKYKQWRSKSKVKAATK